MGSLSFFLFVMIAFVGIVGIAAGIVFGIHIAETRIRKALTARLHAPAAQ